MKTHKLEVLTDKYIGKKGTPERDRFDNELNAEYIGQIIRELRKEKKLTQEELGKLIGVKKSQISKLENSFTNVRIDTILKVFRALNTRINFYVERSGR